MRKVLFLPIVCGLFFCHVLAEDLPTGITGINPINITGPSAFNLTSAANPDFGKCTQIQVSLNNLGRIAGGGLSCASSIAPDGNCQGEDVFGRSGKEPDCKDFRGNDGKFSKSAMRNFIKTKLDPSLCHIGCKRSQIDSIKSELSCIDSQNSILSQKIASLQADYQKVITAGKQEIAKFNQVEQGRKDQVAFSLDKFKEINDASGAISSVLGFAGAGVPVSRSGTQPATTGFISKVETDFKSLKLRKESFDYRKRSDTMFNTIACFKELRSGFTCEIRGDPVSYAQYVGCLYRDSFKKNKSGSFERGNKAIDDRAEDRRKIFDFTLEAILKNAPTTLLQAPTEADESGSAPIQANTADTSGGTLLGVDQLIAKYGDKLKSFKRDFFDPNREILDRLRACENKAKTQIQNQMAEPSSVYNVELIKITEAERAISNRVKDWVDTHAGLITLGYKTLTTQHFPIDTSRCFYIEPAKQLSCMRDIERNLRGLLEGSVPQSRFNLQIPSSVPGLAFNTQCSGLKGCATRMQNIITGLNNEISKTTGQRTARVAFYNNTIDKFTADIKNRVRFDIETLKQRINLANDRLSKIKASPIGSETVEQKALEKSEGEPDHGLYKMPENVLGILGEGILDPKQQNFQESLSSLNGEEREVGERLSELSTSREKFKNKLISCPGEEAANKLKGIGTSVSSLVAKCKDTCDDSVRTKFSDLADTLSGIENINLDVEEVGALTESLNSGFDRCEETGTGTGDNEKRRQDLVAEQAALNAFLEASKACKKYVESKKSLDNATNASRANASGVLGGSQPNTVSPPNTSANDLRKERDDAEKDRNTCESNLDEIKTDDIAVQSALTKRNINIKAIKDTQDQFDKDKQGKGVPEDIQKLGSPNLSSKSDKYKRDAETHIRKVEKDIVRLTLELDKVENRKSRSRASPNECLAQADQLEKRIQRLSDGSTDGGNSLEGR